MRWLHPSGIALALLTCAASAAAQDPADDDVAAGQARGVDGQRGQDGEDGASAEDELVFYGSGVGVYRLRVNFMNELPLSPAVPGTDPRATDELGQEFWVNQWFRIRLETGLRDRIRLVGEMDVFDGLVVGQFAQGVSAADRPRDDATAFPGAQPRALYLEWSPALTHIQAGLTPVAWGLGILDNDGAVEPPFGDFRYGDTAVRVALTTQPWGAESPVHLGFGGDLIFEDQLADVRDGDLAWRGILAAAYREGERRLGLYGIYRHQRSEVERANRTVDDTRDSVTLDAYARWDVDDPSGGTLFGAIEAAYTHVELEVGGPLARGSSGRDELLVVGQVGRRTSSVDLVFELGYASGGGGLDRAVIHPDHRVGLLLFPEVIAWQTARAATLLEMSELLGGPVPAGTRFAPTEGGVAGAVYLFPRATWRITEWMRFRVGAVWGHSVTDVVDPFRQAVQGTRANYRGGDPGNRDLGLELDGQLHAEGELSAGVLVSGGLEGAWFFPGHAFDDASGDTMDPLGLFRVRAGLAF